MTHLTQQLFIGGTNINTDVEKFKNEGGNIIIGTPGRIEDLLMGKTDSSHRNLFVQAAKTLVSSSVVMDRLTDFGFSVLGSFID